MIIFVQTISKGLKALTIHPWMLLDIMSMIYESSAYSRTGMMPPRAILQDVHRCLESRASLPWLLGTADLCWRLFACSWRLPFLSGYWEVLATKGCQTLGGACFSACYSSRGMEFWALDLPLVSPDHATNVLLLGTECAASTTLFLTLATCSEPLPMKPFTTLYNFVWISCSFLNWNSFETVGSWEQL